VFEILWFPAAVPELIIGTLLLLLTSIGAHEPEDEACSEEKDNSKHSDYNTCDLLST